jgi:benzoate-CoA ligase
VDAALLFEVPETFNMVTALLDRHVEEGRGDRVAIYFRDEVISYRNLLARVNRAGNAFRAGGLDVEQRVLLFMADRPAFIEAYLGAMKIGAVPVPINVMTTAPELAYYLADSRATAVVIDADLLDRLPDPPPRSLKRVYVVGADAGSGPLGWLQRCFAEDVAAASPHLEAEPTHRDDPSYWLYSSGTTGQPKGTVHLHRDMVVCTGTWLEHVTRPTAAEINYSASKLPFSYGLVNGLYQPLLAGTATVLVAEPSSPAIVAATIKRYQPTIFFSVPTLYNLMLREHEAGTLELDVTSLRACISAGEALPPAIYERWRARFGREILDGIGSTEFGYIYIQNRPGRSRPGTSGELLPGYAARILGENEEPVGDGEIGELWMQSDSFAAGYWKKRDRSRETFRGPWLKTGDRFTRDADGYYRYAGRGDDMFKSSGQWVSPIEVESALLRHPVVAEAAVIGRQDDDGLVKPKAFVVLKAGTEPATDLVAALQDHVKAEVAPDYYKYPRWIEFVPELPKTATGKIQRFRLRGEP